MRSLILITALLACPAVMAQQNISRVNGAIQTEAGARYGTLVCTAGADPMRRSDPTALPVPLRNPAATSGACSPASPGCTR